MDEINYLTTYIQQAQLTHYSSGVAAISSAVSILNGYENIDDYSQSKLKDKIVSGKQVDFNSLSNFLKEQTIGDYTFRVGQVINDFSTFKKYFDDSSKESFYAYTEEDGETKAYPVIWQTDGSYVINTDGERKPEYMPIMTLVHYKDGDFAYSSVCPQIINIIGYSIRDGIKYLIVGDSFGNDQGETFVDTNNEHPCVGGIYEISFDKFMNIVNNTNYVNTNFENISSAFIVDSRFSV